MFLKDLQHSTRGRRLCEPSWMNWTVMLLYDLLTLYVQIPSANAELVSQARQAHTGWSDWGAWMCRDVCKNSSYVRRRVCSSQNDSICAGNKEMTKPGLCVTNVTCPEDCPVGRYGVNCWGECGHCTSECNKSTGECSVCEPGWQEPITSCDTECPKWSYGSNCSNLCEIKCGGLDCIDRVNGQCPEKADILSYLLVLILIPFIIVIVFLVASPRKRQSYRSSDYLTRTGKIKRWKKQLQHSRSRYGQQARDIHHVTKQLRHEGGISPSSGQSGDWSTQVLVSPG
ncbi:unnamed protein product, partial [Lymnaea stagnalis]